MDPSSTENDCRRGALLCGRAGRMNSWHLLGDNGDTPVGASSSRGGCPSIPESSSLTTNARIVVHATPEDIAGLLECPVCYNILLPPVTLCCEGHSICNDCKEKVQLCPVCRGSLTEVRNRTLEEILDKCMVACRYKDSGCTVILPANELSTHHKVCQNSPEAIIAAANEPSPDDEELFGENGIPRIRFLGFDPEEFYGYLRRTGIFPNNRRGAAT